MTSLFPCVHGWEMEGWNRVCMHEPRPEVTASGGSREGAKAILATPDSEEHDRGLFRDAFFQQEGRPERKTFLEK